MKKIIIDTDPGCDDALALMLMFQSRAFDIKAVTTVAGNSTIEKVTRNAQTILDLINERNVAIYSGKTKPIRRNLVTAVVHGESGLDGVNVNQTKYRLTNNADERIIELVKGNPRKITLLALGPLSNIARAFIKEPKLPDQIKEMVIMGGAINVCGNMNRVAEFNMFVDPEAAEIVFQTDVRKVLIPLDVCNQVIIPITDFEILKKSILYRPIKTMMKNFAFELEKDVGVQGVLVYDAVAAYYLINPEAFQLKPMDIVIETRGEYTLGMTVVEKRKMARNDFNIQVAMDIDKNAFIKDFFDILQEEI